MTVAVGKCNRLQVTGGMHGMQDVLHIFCLVESIKVVLKNSYQSQIITKGFCRLVEEEARLKEGTF